MIKNKELKRRIIEISYHHKLAHIGSCLTAVDIIEDIYQKKGKDDPFILSSGHAGLALYVVIEKHGGRNAEYLLNKMGIHPTREEQNGIWCSTGSLGQGLPIALGMALANRTQDVYCLISDGECAEGSIWESLRVIEEKKVKNIHLFVNANGWGAYHEIDTEDLYDKLLSFMNKEQEDACTLDLYYQNTKDFPFLNGQDAHYHIMNEQEYNLAMEILK